jgi:hypothetical protein
MELIPVVRPEDPLEAARWDDAISSLWFYLLGPGYSAKTEDTFILTKSACTLDELSMEKHLISVQVTVNEDSQC